MRAGTAGHPPILTVNKKIPGGGSVVLHQQYIRGNAVVANAFIEHDVHGTVTRTYLDGHQVVRSKNFSQLVVPGRYSERTYPNGLRSAVFPSGRPMFRERFRTQLVNGVPTRFIERTVYSETVINRSVVYQTPLVRSYVPATFYGASFYAYQPHFWAPTFFAPFVAVSLPTPVVIGPSCYFCPPPVVAFATPVVSYTDPVALLADLAISTAVADAVQPPPPPPDDAWAAAPPPPADDSANGVPSDDTAPLPPADDTQPSSQESTDVTELKRQVAALQQQVAQEQASNADLQQQVATLNQVANGSAAAGADPTAAKPSAAHASAAVFTVPDDVRTQMRKQVKKNIELHQKHQALTWPEIIQSGDAHDFIFQVATSISTVTDDGESCDLTGGDLIKLADDADPNNPALHMHVVTSKVGSCSTDAAVNISVSEAQDMLNEFNSRQETIMEKMRPQLANQPTKTADAAEPLAADHGR